MLAYLTSVKKDRTIFDRPVSINKIEFRCKTTIDEKNFRIQSIKSFYGAMSSIVVHLDSLCIVKHELPKTPSTASRVYVHTIDNVMSQTSVIRLTLLKGEGTPSGFDCSIRKQNDNIQGFALCLLPCVYNRDWR